MADEPTNWAPEWAIAPGEILLEALQERAMSQSELARRMGRPIKTINEIVNGKAAITPDTAIQLELTLGINARFWNNLEAAYRAHLAQVRSEEDLAAHASWASSFPIKDLAKHGLVTPGRTKGSTVAALLRYFSVGSPEAWKAEWAAEAFSYRASPAFVSSPHASAAWLRWGEIVAEDIETAPFSAERFREALREIRELTRRDFALIYQGVQDLCAGAGVALVITPELSGMHLSGAARWLAPDRALIQLSLRYKTDDQFWFSFFHEARHLLGRKKTDHLEAEGSGGDNGPKDPEEEEADRFARDTLIPPDDYARFVEAAVFSEAAIRSFANQLNIAPGIVVGRLQRDDKVARSHFRGLKKSLWPVT